jgi:hypothetical protein
MFKDYGMCNTSLLTGDLAAACARGNLSLHAVFETAMRAFPNVAFASINSKFDWRQIEVFHEMAKGLGNVPRMDKSAFYKKLNTLLERQSRHANYVSYLVNADQHCYTSTPLAYSADITGPEALRALTGKPMVALSQVADTSHQKVVPLMEWLAELPQGASVASQCAGQPLFQDAWHGEDYCDAALVGKELKIASSGTFSLSLRFVGAGAAALAFAFALAWGACCLYRMRGRAVDLRRARATSGGSNLDKAVRRDRVGELRAKTRQIRENLAELRMQLQVPPGQECADPSAAGDLTRAPSLVVPLPREEGVPLIWATDSNTSLYSAATSARGIV